MFNAQPKKDFHMPMQYFNPWPRCGEARAEVAASWLDWWHHWHARWWRAGAAEAAAPSG
jgi:hypothetical protein